MADYDENAVMQVTTAPEEKLPEKSGRGIRFLTDFWEEKYLQEYIRDGGSKIKFVTGRRGSGKTYFLQLMSALARKQDYKTVQFSARDVWMHDFREIYIEIFRQCDSLIR